MTDDDIRNMTKLELHLWFYNRKDSANFFNRKKLHDMGINDSDHSTYHKTANNEHIHCPCYLSWMGIITRCYGQRFQKNHSTYVGTKVHPDWLYFSNFRKWWVSNYVEGWDLDKDILYHPQKHGPDKIYGPDTCIFIPRWLNVFASIHQPGRHGRGVNRYKNSYFFVKSTIPYYHKMIRINYIKTAEEAYVIYIRTKLTLIKSIKKDLDVIHPDLHMGLIRFIMSLPRF